MGPSRSVLEIGKRMGLQLISELSRRVRLVAATGIACIGLVVLSLPATVSAEEFAPLPQPTASQKVAIFAGGCFWCVESDFDKVPGVVSTTSGYTGGHTERPSYKQVTYKDTGHYEAVQVVYDPEIVSYDALLTAFWHSVDPTDDGGQFCDRGDSYRPAIFAVDEDQRMKAEASKASLEEADVLAAPIATPILDAATFYAAETYHQDYYTKNPIRYAYYRNGCRRDARIKQVWGDLAFKGIPKS